MYIRLILNFNTQRQYALTNTHNGAISVTLSLVVAKLNSSGTYAHPVQSSCRFYARVCEMTP